MHGRSQAAVNHMAGGAFRYINMAVGRYAATNIGGVDPAIRVARNAVPMERGGIAQATHGHGGAGHDLVASCDDWSFQYP